MATPRCRNCQGSTWTDDGCCRTCSDVPTLGHDVAAFIHAYCVIPDGDYAGAPYMLTDEQYRLLLNHYRVHPRTGAFVHFRGTQYVRPQKHGKGPFSAAIICAEADSEAPVLFDGWDASGLPVGRGWPTPWIQVTAVSEDQTANIWRALVPMIEMGPLVARIPDTGETRINLPGGGLIEPVTASARSRLGQRLTFAVQDEAHSWLERNGGRLLADNQRRNLAGVGGRFLETGNAWDPREESVAQKTFESGEPGVYRDDIDPGTGSVRNKTERRRMIRKVYGDSMTKPKRPPGEPPVEWEPWVDIDRIDGEIVALLARGDASQAERFFLNRKQAGEDAAFPPGLVDARSDAGHVVAEKAVASIGVDGARFVDALAIVATELATGFQWPVGIWERPEHAAADYEHPFDEIDGAMLDAFDRFDVRRLYIDPQWIDHLLDKWQARWGQKRVMPWYTNRPRQVCWAVRSFLDAAAAADWSHAGDEMHSRHMTNARKYPMNVFDDKHRQMHSMAKDRPDSPRKIDAAMASLLSWEARSDCIAAGDHLPKPVYRARGFN